MPRKEKDSNKQPKKTEDNPETNEGRQTGREGGPIPKGAQQGSVPKEFFNPKSMLTPGLCGGVTMLITNALASQFGAPPNYTGLIISCLFGLIVFAATATVLWLRIVFWALNSLVIFSIALGTNQIGAQASKPKTLVHLDPTTNAPPVMPSSAREGFFANWLGENEADENLWPMRER